MMIIFIGGMSESGKSYLCEYIVRTKNAIRLKIIQIEKELMDAFSLTYATKAAINKSLTLLYQKENIFQLFLNKILEKTYDQVYDYVVLDSLYRKELFTEIQKIYPNTYCWFIQAAKSQRIKREKNKPQYQNWKLADFLTVFENKEKFKTLHNAPLVKQVSTHLIKNNSTKNKLHKKIDKKLHVLKTNLLKSSTSL